MSLHLKLLLTALFWGATPTIARMLSVYEAPLVIVAGRFGIAALFLLAFAVAAGQLQAVPRRLWWRFVLLALCGIVLHNGLMFKGLEYTSATTASIILALVAVQVLLLDLLLYRRRPSLLEGCGVALAFIGAVVVITDGELARVVDVGRGRGEILIFFSALAWALYSVLGRAVLAQYPALMVTTWTTLIGLVLLVPFLFRQPAVTLAIYSDVQAVMMIGFLGFLGSALGFYWYYEAVAALGTVGTAIYINLVPVFGVLSAAVFLDEQAGPWLLVGGLLVLSGVALVNVPFFRSQLARAAAPANRPQTGSGSKP